MDKKIISLLSCGIMILGMIGCSNSQEQLQEEINSSLELLKEENSEKSDKFYSVENTNVIVEEMIWETNKTEIAFNRNKTAFTTIWNIVIDLGIEDNNKQRKLLTDNGFENVDILYFIKDENDEIIAVIYDEKVYYDEVYKINEIEKLEEKFQIDIHIK